MYVGRGDIFHGSEELRCGRKELGATLTHEGILRTKNMKTRYAAECFHSPCHPAVRSFANNSQWKFKP